MVAVIYRFSNETREERRERKETEKYEAEVFAPTPLPDASDPDAIRVASMFASLMSALVLWPISLPWKRRDPKSAWHRLSPREKHELVSVCACGLTFEVHALIAFTAYLTDQGGWTQVAIPLWLPVLLAACYALCSIFRAVLFLDREL